MAIETPQQPATPAQAVVFETSYTEGCPWFECLPAQWERYTRGMTPAGCRQLSNLLAHHCLLVHRDRYGWILTRFDLILEGRPFWHVSNAGVLTYDYDPATAMGHAEPGRAPEPPRDAPWRGEQIRRIKEASTLHLRDGTGAMDALYTLAVAHGASAQAAAGHAHNANGAMSELQGAIYSMATLAAHPVTPATPDPAR